MAKNVRQGTIDALSKYHARIERENRPKKARAPNSAPEKEVERECLAWMRKRGWNVQIFEAKATWSKEANCWLSQGMKAGTCDCIGNTADGFGVFVEFKALGKLSTFNRESNGVQRKFILDKINSGVFACVVDSAVLLEIIFDNWMKLKLEGLEASKKYLISVLPIMSEKTRLKEEALFDED